MAWYELMGGSAEKELEAKAGLRREEGRDGLEVVVMVWKCGCNGGLKRICLRSNP